MSPSQTPARAASAATLDGDGEPKQLRPTAKQTVEKWIDANGKMVPSAKTQAIKAQLLEWFSEKEPVKVIIYTQFITMIRILKKMCDIEGWRCLELSGNQSQSRRDDNLHAFKQPTGPQILIATMSVGGVGLNLTEASRVIIVDLWWNTAAEQQAFCRTYRRGQTKPTYLTRFFVQGSIDDHLLQMQSRKDREISQVMSESSRSRKLTTDELLELFGPVKKDSSGKAFILADNDDGDDDDGDDGKGNGKGTGTGTGQAQAPLIDLDDFHPDEGDSEDDMMQVD